MIKIGMIGIVGLGAAVAAPGAWERFSTAEHAEAWSLFDFSDDGIYDVVWEDSSDPFISATTFGDGGVWWYVDELSGQDELVGNYRGVETVWAELFIDDPDEVDFIDLVISIEVGGETRFCYSSVVQSDDLTPLGGWEPLEFELSGTWFFLNDENEFEAFQLTRDLLANVGELGFRVFPRQGAEDQFFGLDNVQLVARKEDPQPSVSLVSQGVRLQFQPRAGVSYRLDGWDFVTKDWAEVSGVGSISGSQPFSLVEPEADFGMYRLRMRNNFVEIAVPD